MVANKGCPSWRTSYAAVARPTQISKELPAPLSDISVSCRLVSGSQTSSYPPRLSLLPAHQFVHQSYLGLLRERHCRSLDRFLKKRRYNRSNRSLSRI